MEELSRRQIVAFCFLLLLLISTSYANTLQSPLNFDDRLVIKTEIAQSGKQYFDFFPPRYRHLFYLSLAINYSQGKLNPLGYHLFNISLHFLTTLTVFLISYITIKRGTGWGRYAVPITVITTLFFTLNPVHSETVTYISGRASGLSGMFYFSSLLFFMLGSFRERAAGSRVFCYLVSVPFFVAAVLSKEISFTLPAIILLYDFCFMRGDRWSPRKTRLLYFYFPLFVCAALSIFKVLFMKSMIVEWWQKIDFDYALQQARIIGHGIHLLLFPIGLTFDYHFPDAFFPHPALRAWPILLLVGLMAGVIKYFPKAGKMVCFGVLWFILTIAPTNSFLPRLDLLSERNLYIPSFGIFFLMASIGVPFFLSQGSKLRNIGGVCFATVLIFHATLLIDRNATYRSNIAIWEDVVQKAPGKTRAWNNLSHYYLKESNYEKAFESLQGLMQSNPSTHYLAYAQSKLGIIYSRWGDLPKAIVAYEEGIRLDPFAPINPLNLGGVYARQGNLLKAKETYEQAERLFKSDPSWRNVPPNLYLMKAHILFKLGLFEQAETTANIYLNLAPGSSSGHALRGKIYAAMGKNAKARREFSKVVK